MLIDMDENPEAFIAAYQAELNEEDAESGGLRCLPTLTRVKTFEEVLGPVEDVDLILHTGKIYP